MGSGLRSPAAPFALTANPKKVTLLRALEIAWRRATAPQITEPERFTVLVALADG